MDRTTRRTILGRIGATALGTLAGLGATRDPGLFGPWACAEGDRLDFGELEPLVAVIQETEADALLPRLVAQVDAGISLRTLVSAAALANARTFGGHDYVGYHCFMAMIPALEMAGWLEGSRTALPVLKVLHRNAVRIQQKGGSEREALRLRSAPAASGADGDATSALLAATRRGDLDAAEARLLQLVGRSPEDAFAALQPVTRDNIDVHQVVLTFRSWDMLRLTNGEHADVLLRQALRQCVDREAARRKRGHEAPPIRTLLPQLVEAHGLDRDVPVAGRLSDAELADLADVFFTQSRDEAARQAAKRLAEGVSRADVGEALSLASARLLLHDPGKTRAQPGKPVGSVHGASIGVHAADSAQAWRGIGAAADAPTANACLVTGAWHTAGQMHGMDPSTPHHAGAREDAATVAPERLLGAIDEALRSRDQAAAAALAERYGEEGGDPEALIASLLGPAIDHDGALHHEKYFLTATQEFARSRPAHRWVHLVALTRVLASGYGFEAPGVAQAKDLLGV